jgi:hypothetical protein
MELQRISHGALTGLSPALVRQPVARAFVDDRIIGPGQGAAAHRARAGVRDSGQSQGYSNDLGPSQVLRCRWQFDGQTGRLEARWAIRA